MHPAARSVRHFFLSPSTFFEDRPPAETLPVAAGIVLLFAVSLVATVWLLGSMLAGAFDGTVTVDNPSRPSDSFCNGHAGGSDSTFAQGCDEPETIERDPGELINEAISPFYAIAFFVPFVLWLLGGGVLYAAGRLSGGTPSFRGTFALAGWAAVPELFRLAAVLLGFRFALADVTIRDPERGVDVLEAAIAPLEPVLLAASFVTVGWQWFLLTGGLHREAEISRKAAAVAVAIPLGLLFLFEMV